jgi:hypothetical protein
MWWIQGGFEERLEKHETTMDEVVNTHGGRCLIAN